MEDLLAAGLIVIIVMVILYGLDKGLRF